MSREKITPIDILREKKRAMLIYNLRQDKLYRDEKLTSATKTRNNIPNLIEKLNTKYNSDKQDLDEKSSAITAMIEKIKSEITPLKDQVRRTQSLANRAKNILYAPDENIPKIEHDIIMLNDILKSQEKDKNDIQIAKSALLTRYTTDKAYLDKSLSTANIDIEREEKNKVDIDTKITEIQSTENSEFERLLLETLNKDKTQMKAQYLDLIEDISYKYDRPPAHSRHKKEIVKNYHEIIKEIKIMKPRTEQSLTENKQYYDIIRKRMKIIQDRDIMDRKKQADEIQRINSKLNEIQSKLRRDNTKLSLDYINKIAGDIALLACISEGSIVTTKQFIELKDIFNHPSDEPFILKAAKIMNDILTEDYKYLLNMKDDYDISDMELELLFENSLKAIRPSYSEIDTRNTTNTTNISYKYIKYKTKYLELK